MVVGEIDTGKLYESKRGWSFIGAGKTEGDGRRGGEVLANDLWGESKVVDVS